MHSEIPSAPQDIRAADEKRRRLYCRQKELLDTFLAHHAISQAQYDKSLGDLTVKMGYAPKQK